MDLLDRLYLLSPVDPVCVLGLVDSVVLWQFVNLACFSYNLKKKKI